MVKIESLHRNTKIISTKHNHNKNFIINSAFLRNAYTGDSAKYAERSKIIHPI